MKRWIALITALLVLAGLPALAAKAPDALKGWKYFKEIKINGSNPYTAVFLDTDTYRGAGTNLQDVRIADENGELVPYAVINAFESVLREPDRSYDALQLRTYQVKQDTVYDYSVTVPANTDPLVNQLDVIIDDTPFLVRTAVYGSYDNLTWDRLSETKVYRINDKAQKSITFDEGYKYRFYRVYLINNLDGLSVSSLVPRFVGTVSRTYASYTRETALPYTFKSENKTSVYRISNPNRVRVNRLTLSLSGDFSRDYELFRIEGKHRVYLAGGTLYQLTLKKAQASHTSIDLPETAAPGAFELVVRDGDNKALKPSKVTALFTVDRLVFAAVPDHNYRLVFGKGDAAAPEYDLAAFKAELEKSDLNQGTLGPRHSFAVPASNQVVSTRVLFNGLLIVIMLVLGFVIVRKLPKAQS
ncbi:MAG: DUF3999 family protein [Solirubrobacterales bacterium]